jgi:uncharacterized protein YyaL (SSP411 family)
MTPPPNRLASQTSPYLLQHAHNPVDWYPWGEEALTSARDREVPIFLSIGYSACHWCHVMERESFEDTETAALMNEHFVSIKVDREERPDLDGIYMDAVQAMNGHGGWPLSAFLTPAGEPFYAGTYFPPEPAHGMPSFRQVLTGIAQAWSERRDELVVQAEQVTASIARAGELRASDSPLTEALTADAMQGLRRSFDPRWGGFGAAPKFPQPMVLEFLLRQALRGTPDALEMAVITLDRMAEGGMYDQLGGGFARYATDAAWHVPHFEKMLYDNAQLLQLYVRAWQVTGNATYRRVASETAEYLIREMQHPEGGFWSSQDADSEGEEGRFFVWTWDELVALVGEPVARCLGASPEGNWEGTNVLWRPVSVSAVAREFDLDAEALQEELSDARSVLFTVREARKHPGTDDKILTAWNAMAIRAFAEAGRVLGEPAWVEAGARCADFVLRHLRDERGRLLRSWRAGVAGGPGFADDHALMAAACLTLYETTFEPRWFEVARGLADQLIERFADEERGGFFQTGADGERLLVRPKDLYDNAVPGANSVAAEVLQRIARFTGEGRYEQAGVSGLRLVRDVMAKAPTGFGHALCALDLYLGPTREVAVIGDPQDAATRRLLDEVTVRAFRPNVVLAAAAGEAAASSSIALLRDRTMVDGAATAYVCERFACRLPVTQPAALVSQLADQAAAVTLES